jgi:hypothetical protein
METLLEQRRARLVNRAAGLRQEPLALVRENNGLAPIVRLPAEVLSQIFVLVRDAVDCAESEGLHGVHWCALTLVCRQWTDVAVGTPHLWCVVTFTEMNCRFSHASLVRAGAVPLHVTVHQVPESEEMTVLAAIAGRMAQVKELDLFVGQSLNGIITNMALLSTVAALQLERLSLSHSHSWFLNGVRDEAIKDVLFANIFQGHMPQLRTLTLATYGPFWESVLLRCPLLSNLRLSGPITRSDLTVNNSENFMEAEVLAGVLTKLPLLEHLALIHALPPSLLPDHSKAAQMDRLRSVAFCSRFNMNVVAYGWQCMHIPRTASMNIECNLSHPQSALPELSPQLEEQICSHIEMGRVESLTFACEVVAEPRWRTSVKACGSDMGGLRLQLVHTSNETEVPDVLNAILPALSPAFAATGTVYIDSASCSPVSPYILSLLPAVRTLHLVDNGAGAVIDVLSCATADNNEHRALCLLRDIHINNAHLSDAVTLPSWLETRRDLGLPVRSLSFVGCTYQWSSETDVAFRESVCAAVKNVAWSDWHRYIPAKVVSTNFSSW